MSKHIGSIFLGAVAVVTVIGGGYLIFHAITTPVIHHVHPLIDYKNMTYTVAGKPVTLVNGVASTAIATGTASTAVTQYYGDNLYKDLNGDGVPDSVFLLTQNSGGSGTFYYVVAGVSTATSSVGVKIILSR